jgi:hypothetical protein
MAWIRIIATEVFGLFVDDGSLAIATLAWLLLTAFVLPRLGLGAGWIGTLLFGGLALVLLENTLRRARVRLE